MVCWDHPPLTRLAIGMVAKSGGASVIAGAEQEGACGRVGHWWAWLPEVGGTWCECWRSNRCGHAGKGLKSGVSDMPTPPLDCPEALGARDEPNGQRGFAK